MSTRSLVHLGFEAEADAFRRFIERSAAGSADELQVFYGVGGERRLPEGERGRLGGAARAGPPRGRRAGAARARPGAAAGAAPIRVGTAAAGQLQLDAYGHLLERSRRWFERGHPPDDDYWRFLVELVDCAARRWSEPDRGIWEWRGEPRHFVHSKALCWAALEHGIELARRCGRRAPERRWRRERDAVRAAIEREGFDAGRNTFVQAFGEPALDAALLRLPAVGL